MADRRVSFGEFSEETGDFVRWSGLGVLGDIDAAWRRLGRDPNNGDLGYLVVLDE